MIKLNYFAFLSALVFSSTLAYKAQAVDIATVDVVKVVSTANATVELQKKLEAAGNQLRQEAQTEQAAIRAEREALEAKKGKLDAASFKKQEQELNKKIEAAQTAYGQKSEKVRQSFENASKKTQEELDKVYKKVAVDKGITILLPKAGILYSEAGTDLTNEILAEFNKTVTKIDTGY